MKKPAIFPSVSSYAMKKIDSAFLLASSISPSPKRSALMRKSFNIYAHTREECEKKLAEMIVEVKAKIAAEKAEKQ